MSVRVGSAIFENHVSMEVVPNKWTDTLVFPLRHDRALPPWDYAEAVGVQLVLVFLAMAWVRDAAGLAFIDAPKTSAVIVAERGMQNYGQSCAYVKTHCRGRKLCPCSAHEWQRVNFR